MNNFISFYNQINVGDVCLYGFPDGNGSLAVVKVLELKRKDRDDEDHILQSVSFTNNSPEDVIAKLQFIYAVTDNTGNNYFEYLQKNEGTMWGSLCYLRNLNHCSYNDRAHWEWYEDINPSSPEGPEEVNSYGWRCSNCLTDIQEYLLDTLDCPSYYDNPDEPPSVAVCPCCGAPMKVEEN